MESDVFNLNNYLIAGFNMAYDLEPGKDSLKVFLNNENNPDSLFFDP